MGWQDAPFVDSPAWQNAPLVDESPPPPKPQPPSVLQQLGRGVGLSARALAQGAASLPMMIPDAVTGVYDFIQHPHPVTWRDFNPFGGTPENLPSNAFSRSLDPYLPRPQTRAEKIMSIGLAMEGGALTPQITIPSNVPANFQPPSLAKNQQMADLLGRTQKEGYVVPPATTNPTAGNKALETIGGKIATAQTASSGNQAITDSLAKRALDLNPDAPLNAEVPAAVRSEAGQAYKALRNVGEIPTSDAYRQQLASILEKYKGAGESFPELARKDIAEEVAKIDKPSFTGNAAVDATKILRENADKAFRSGDTGLGGTYRSMSQALESEIERNLSSRGEQYAEVLQNFRDARQKIATSYSVENALNPSTGHVSAIKLANALKKGEPLTDELKTAAEFGAAFPRAAQEPTHSLGVSHLDLYGSVGGALAGQHLVHSPWGMLGAAAIPASRAAARAYLLSKMGQAAGIPATQLSEGLPRVPQALVGAYGSP